MILKELKHHIPFTALATLLAIILTIILYLNNITFSQIGSLFNIIHPIHILVSAIVTSAIFFKYKKSIPLALLTGLTGAIIIGSFSDIILPYLGGLLFQIKLSFHLPLIEKPILILSSAIIGSLVGISTKLTKLPHFFHVLLSVFASLFYLLAFSTALTIPYLIAIFFVVFIAVIVFCCLSDIIYPLLFINKK